MITNSVNWSPLDPLNKELHSHGFRQRQSLLRQIIEIQEKINTDMKDSSASLEIPCRKRSHDTTILKNTQLKKMTHVCMSNPATASKFKVMNKLLNSVHTLLSTDKWCTKRDMYYQDPEFYGNQRTVDSAVEDIAAMLQVPRWQLHVVATSKGLIYGPLKFLKADKTIVDCTNSENGTLLPATVHDISLLSCTARQILVVEKDATFQHLLQSKVWNTIGPTLILTAKGYPDLNTRLLLANLSRTFPGLPLYSLVDADPHGIEIYLVYRFGSAAQPEPNLTCPRLRWLGVLPSDKHRLQLPDSVSLKMTPSNSRKLKSILSRRYVKQLAQAEYEELELMRENAGCMEIQGLDSLGRHFLTEVYLPDRLKTLHATQHAAEC